MTDSRRVYQQCPPGLLVGLGLGLVAQWAGTVVAQSDVMRGNLLQAAGLIAATWLAATGARELAGGLPTRQARGAHVAAIGFALLTVCRCWWLVQHVRGGDDDLRMVGWAAMVITSVGVVWAAGGLRRPVLAIAVVVIGALVIPVPPLVPMIKWLVPWHDVLFIYDLAANLVWTVLVLVAVTRAATDAAAPPEQRANATSALKLAGKVLWVRVAFATVGASLVGFQIIALVNVTFVATAALSAVTLLLFAIALVKVAAASGTGLARGRLHVGAFLALVGGVVQAVQAAATYVSYASLKSTVWPTWKLVYHPDYRDTEALIDCWSLAAPLAAALGIVLLVSAIGRFGRAIGDVALQTAAKQAGALFMILMLGSIALRAQLGNVSTLLGVVLVFSFSSSIAVGAQVIVAALCGKASIALGKVAGMPTATARSV